MPEFKPKDEYALAYDADRKRLRQEARIQLDVMLNGAYAELAKLHTEAQQRGEVVRVVFGPDEVKGLLNA